MVPLSTAAPRTVLMARESLWIVVNGRLPLGAASVNAAKVGATLGGHRDENDSGSATESGRSDDATPGDDRLGVFRPGRHPPAEQ